MRIWGVGLDAVCEAGIYFDLVELKKSKCDVVQLEWERYRSS